MIKNLIFNIFRFIVVVFCMFFIANLFYLSGQLDALYGVSTSKMLKLSKEQNDSIANIPKLFELYGKDLK